MAAPALSCRAAVLVALLLARPPSRALAQPCGDGGGGGGGGGDGGSGGSSSPTCPPNCRSCTTDHVCDFCYTGYRLNREGQCDACAANCESCDYAGAGWCDTCFRGYTAVDRLCEACAPNCVDCDRAGPGRCDTCDSGFFVSSSRLCEKCAPNCRKCWDADVSSCQECFTMYKMREGGVCTLNKTLSTLLATSVLGLVALFAQLARAGARQSRRPGGLFGLARTVPVVPSHESYVGLAGGDARQALPSGLWRGYYTVAGRRHDVCEFDLAFDAGSSRISGDGVDDIGKYAMRGLHRGRRMAFTKAYDGRSTNAAGVRHFGNLGHTVEYRGEQAGATLGDGFRGTWSIRHPTWTYDGTFHLWPCTAGFADSPSAGGAADDPGSGQTFTESECVVCFDRPISTRLRPCGHVALCGTCASRLSPRKCPLCRREIARVESRAGGAG